MNAYKFMGFSFVFLFVIILIGSIILIFALSSCQKDEIEPRRVATRVIKKEPARASTIIIFDTIN